MATDPAAGKPLLTLDDVEIAYGDVVACSEISIEVKPAEIVALIGANGAGKSTTLRGIAGALRARHGRVIFNGADVTRRPAYERTDLGIALVPEGRRVFPYMSVLENLEMGGFKDRRDRAGLRQRIESIMELFPRLRERSDQRAGTLSGGEQQMLAIGRAMMSRPRLLLLDEPSLGLAPIVVENIFRMVRRINAEGVAILLVEQNAHYALGTASRGYVLQTGRVVAAGACDVLRADPRVTEAYLGSAS